MRGHPDGCTCGGCRPNMPFTGYPSEWSPGESWPHETLTWLAGSRPCILCREVVERARPAGWLRDQVHKAAAALDDLPPEMVKQMCHRTNVREAANDRGTDRPA